MFAVIFEVQPKAGRKDEYLDLAKHLKPILESIDGFIDNERFGSKRTEGRVLSLSIWRDEKAIVRWRTQAEHHRVQGKGRFEVFADYHLRVGEVTMDTQPPAGATVGETRLDETEIGTAKVCTLTEVTPAENNSLAGKAEALPAQLGLDHGRAGLVDHEVFESIYNPGKLLLLGSWKDVGTARAWAPKPFAGVSSLRQRSVRIIRDYGMHERREAPQYYPEVKSDPRGG